MDSIDKHKMKTRIINTKLDTLDSKVDRLIDMVAVILETLPQTHVVDDAANRVLGHSVNNDIPF